MKIFGIYIEKAKKVEISEVASPLLDYYEAHRHGFERIRVTLHDLPFILNFETNEQREFCHAVLNQNQGLIRVNCLQSSWIHKFVEKLKPQLLRITLGRTTPVITEEALDKIFARSTTDNFGEYLMSDMLYIVNLIFQHNLYLIKHRS